MFTKIDIKKFGLYKDFTEERGDGLTFPYGRRAKPSLFDLRVWRCNPVSRVGEVTS